MVYETADSHGNRIIVRGIEEMGITKSTVLANVPSMFEPLGYICITIARNANKSVTVSDVKVLLMQLTEEGLVETRMRGDILHYRKV